MAAHKGTDATVRSEPAPRSSGGQALWAYRDLLVNLVAKEIKVRFMGAALGFAWSLVHPLVLTLTYLLVFTYIFRPAQANYALYLIVGILHWMFFSQNLLMGSEILVANAGLIRKIRFPRVLVPISLLLVNSSLWLVGLAVFLLLLPFMGGSYHWALIAYPAYLLLFLGFNLGVVLILGVIYIDFRDSKHLMEVFLQVLFWATPILYTEDMLPAPARALVLSNPLAPFMGIFHAFFYARQLPSAALTLQALAWTAGVLGGGLLLFGRRMPRLVERL